jgi:sugar phosphate isomerase/epimerase
MKIAAGFTASMAIGNGLSAAKADLRSIQLGLDGHSMRGMRWKAGPLIDYAASLKLDAVLLNGLQYFESIDEKHLKDLRNQADSQGIRIYIGVGGVSRNSSSYRDNWGEPLELITTGIRVATTLGSPSLNVRIGSINDRLTEGGIEARIEESVKVLRASSSRAQDAGIKFGFENHAGDMRTEEILELIKAVGTDVCGIMLDPGNSLWAMEDPMEQLRKLGKYTVCTSIRDWNAWQVDDGAMFQWTAIGSGMMDVPEYVRTFARLCPGVPFNVETISNEHRPLPFLTDEHMKMYPNLKAADITDFLKLIRRGHPIPLEYPDEDEDKRAFDQRHQRFEFERSIRYLRQRCGVGKEV